MDIPKEARSKKLSSEEPQHEFDFHIYEFYFMFKGLRYETVDINVELDIMKKIFKPKLKKSPFHQSYIYQRYFYYENNDLKRIYKLLLKFGKSQEQNRGPFKTLESEYDKQHACYDYFI